jgi:hypothetical protein
MRPNVGETSWNYFALRDVNDERYLPYERERNACQGDALEITNRTYASGETIACSANISIAAGPAVVVSKGANVSYLSPTVVLRNGFSVATGGIFYSGYDGVAGSTSRVAAHRATTGAGKPDIGIVDSVSAFSGKRDPVQAAQRIGLMDLPQHLLDLLETLGVDLKALRDIFSDAEGNLIVFVSDEDILGQDTNDLSDVYLYDTFAGELMLLSRSVQGGAGNGASSYPAMDGFGEFVVFQSMASNLVYDDNNEVSDIFLAEIVFRQTERITDACYFYAGLATAAAHPSIDAEGNNLLYDRIDEEGFRQIYGCDLGLERSQLLSLPEDDYGFPADNHHPAISANGRYVAYIEVIPSEEGSTCNVHVLNREDGAFARTPCPEALARDRERVRPQFTDGARWIEWYRNDGASSVAVANPLAH